jgi:hypothetical protein
LTLVTNTASPWHSLVFVYSIINYSQCKLQHGFTDIKQTILSL